MGFRWSRSYILPVVFMILSCGKHEVRFGTPEYWELPPEERFEPRVRFIEDQKGQAERLNEQTLSYGTFHAKLIARQYSAWLSWALDIEDDPVHAAEILSQWKKEIIHVRRGRKKDPESIDELISWVLSFQRSETGSWAPDNAPIWLHIDEIARALEIIRSSNRPVELKQRILPLGVIREPGVIRTMLREALERSRRTGYTRELSAMAWLPWLRFATRSEVEWPEGWDDVVRSVCIREWINEDTGGFSVDIRRGFDLSTTYRLIRGWNEDGLILSYTPSPQNLARTLIAMADTLPMAMKSQAAALLVGCMADQDSLVQGYICSILAEWREEAFTILTTKQTSGDSLEAALSIAITTGLGGGQPAEWISLAGCTGIRSEEYDTEKFRDQIRDGITSIVDIATRARLRRYMSLLL